MNVNNDTISFLEKEIKNTEKQLTCQREFWNDTQEPIATTLKRLDEQQRLLRVAYGM